MSYQIKLNADEFDALSWIADRYHSAHILLDGLEAPDENEEGSIDSEGAIFTLSEPDAWRYLEALDTEDGSPDVPPCAGGTLAEKLLKLKLSIV